MPLIEPPQKTWLQAFISKYFFEIGPSTPRNYVQEYHAQVQKFDNLANVERKRSEENLAIATRLFNEAKAGIKKAAEDLKILQENMRKELEQMGTNQKKMEEMLKKEDITDKTGAYANSIANYKKIIEMKIPAK